MKFTTMPEISETVRRIHASEHQGSRRCYTIQFKAALMLYATENKIHFTELALATGLRCDMLQRWNKQYLEGLYSMEGAYSVSTKAIKLNTEVLTNLKKQLTDIQSKIALIEQCEAMGLKVAA